MSSHFGTQKPVNKNIKFFTEFYRNIFDIPYRNTFVKHEDVEGYPVPYLQPHDSYTRKNRTAVLSEKEMDRVIVRFNKYMRGVKNRENTEALRGHAMESEFFLEVMRRDLRLEAQEKNRARMQAKEEEEEEEEDSDVEDGEIEDESARSGGPVMSGGPGVLSTPPPLSRGTASSVSWRKAPPPKQKKKKKKSTKWRIPKHDFEHTTAMRKAQRAIIDAWDLCPSPLCETPMREDPAIDDCEIAQAQFAPKPKEPKEPKEPKSKRVRFAVGV